MRDSLSRPGDSRLHGEWTRPGARRKFRCASSRRMAFTRPRATTSGSRSCAATMTIGAVCARRWEMNRSHATRAMRPRRDVASIARRSIRRSRPGATRSIAEKSKLAFRRAASLPTRCRTAPMRIADPQFAHRGHFVAVEHSTLGKFTVEGPRAKLSRTPAAVRRAAPSLGQDNQHVLESILGYDETRITELVASGALG